METEDKYRRQFELPDIFYQTDDGAFRAHLPFSSLNYWIEKNGPIGRGLKAFGHLQRLDDINSLSLISVVGPTPESFYFKAYHHKRSSHSKGVAVVAVAILGNNQFDKKQILTGAVAALLDDNATPALGDATKIIDPTNLDEEYFWQESVDEGGMEFIKNGDLSMQEIDDIIHNRGVMGEVQNISDRIFYVMQDVSNTTNGKIDYTDPSHAIFKINHILTMIPQIGDIYKDVVINEKENLVYFSNPDRLGNFLILRALMFRHLYMEPTSQGRDLFMANLMRPLYAVGEITPQQLRKMTDTELLSFLGKHYKLPGGHNGDWINDLLTEWIPQYITCETMEEAEKAAREVSGTSLVLGIKECKGFDAGLSHLTLDEHNKIVPFEDVQLDSVGQVRKIHAETKAFYVFHSDISADTSLNRVLRQLYWRPPHPSLATEPEMG